MGKAEDINTRFETVREHARNNSFREPYYAAFRPNGNCGYARDKFYRQLPLDDPYGLDKALYWEGWEDGVLQGTHKAPKLPAEVLRVALGIDFAAPQPPLGEQLWWETAQVEQRNEQERLIALRRSVRSLVNYD